MPRLPLQLLSSSAGDASAFRKRRRAPLRRKVRAAFRAVVAKIGDGVGRGVRMGGLTLAGFVGLAALLRC